MPDAASQLRGASPAARLQSFAQTRPTLGGAPASALRSRSGRGASALSHAATRRIRFESSSESGDDSDGDVAAAMAAGEGGDASSLMQSTPPADLGAAAGGAQDGSVGALESSAKLADRTEGAWQKMRVGVQRMGERCGFNYLSQSLCVHVTYSALDACMLARLLLTSRQVSSCPALTECDMWTQTCASLQLPAAQCLQSNQ